MKRKLLSIVQIINIISILIFFNTVIHDYLISYILTRALLIYQFIWIILGLYLLYQRKIREPDYVLLFLFPLLLLQYVVKGYSSGLASLPSDIRVLPRMRATVAYEILHDSGRLDPLLEPHLAYPQEFIVVYILKLVTSRLIVELYEGVMKPLSLIFWTILMMLLYESVFKDIRYAIAELSLVGLLTALLLTFLPGYSSEVGYAYFLLVMIFYLLLSRESFSKNLLLPLIMLSLGVIVGSQRFSFDKFEKNITRLLESIIK